MSLGGFGPQHPATPEIQAKFSTPEVLAAISAVLGSEVSAVTVISYQTQVVRALARPSHPRSSVSLAYPHSLL